MSGYHLPLRGWAFHRATGFMVRCGLRGIWLQGEVPAHPFIWATNHHHWWDAFVATAILKPWDRKVTVMVSADNLTAFPALAWIHAISTDRPSAARAALDEGWTLVIMPEGVMRGPGPLGPIRPGAQWLARHTGRPVHAVSTRVVIRGHQHAEAFVRISDAVPPDALADVMAADLAALDDAIANEDPNQPLPGFRRVLRGRMSVQDTGPGGWAMRRRMKG